MSLALEAPSPPVRTRVGDVVGVLWAYTRRDAVLTWSYRFPFLIGVGQSVVSIVFLYFLAQLIGRHVAGVTGGYFGFAVIGTAMLTVFTATLTAVAQRLRTDQTTGTLEVLFTMPPSPSVCVLGAAVFPVLYAVASAVLTIALALPLGMHLVITPASGLAAASVVVSSLAVYGSAGVVFGAFVLVFKRVDTLIALVTAGLTVLGGVYYPLSLMPKPLRLIADAIPLTWAVSALRTTVLAGQVPLARVLLLWAFALLLLPVSLLIFRVAFEHSRRAGTLGQY